MKKKIKVLHVFKSYYPDTKGGVEKIIDELCILTKNYKIQSDIYTLSNARKVVKRKNYKIYFEKKTFELFSCPFSINSIFHFKDIVRGYDVIHYHFPWPFMDFLHLVLKIKKKFIVTYHSDIIKQKKLKFFYNYFKNKFLSKAYKIVFTSNNYKQTSELSQKLKKNSLVIPLGLNNRRSTSKRKFKKKIKSNYFIFIGQLRHYKGIDTIINCPDSDKYKIVILGSGEKENIIFENLKKKKKNIIFYKNKNDEFVKETLKNSLGLILPSTNRAEAFGVVLIEAMMQKKPIITTDIGTGTTFVNKHRKTGIVIRKNSSYSLKRSMDYIYNNHKKRDYMGKNAYKRYLKFFTGEKMTTSYEKLYRSAINKE